MGATVVAIERRSARAQARTTLNSSFHFFLSSLADAAKVQGITAKKRRERGDCGKLSVSLQSSGRAMTEVPSKNGNTTPSLLNPAPQDTHSQTR